METNQENNEKETTEKIATGTAKQWLQDNLRILISILIVVLIAGGIYSYSKRTESTEKIADSNITTEEMAKLSQGEETKAPEQTAATTSETEQGTTSSVAASQETEGSFIETAAKGDGLTKLARRALADYLEKNPDSALTAEHKIYVEDFLRKNVQHQGGVHIGTSVEFEKNLISQAITKSKGLGENQLQNLHKYAARAPSLS